MSTRDIARWVVLTCAAMRCVTSAEKELQDELERLFLERYPQTKREFQLAEGSVVDFLIGSVAVEVKTDGSPASVSRQLHRYAGAPIVERLVLVTTRRKHQAAIPSSLRGKPVSVALISPL